MEQPKLSLQGVRKSFGGKVVLDGLDLDVYPGESVVVIGGSGTGKSVMLKCVLGLMQPDAGRILVDGEDITHLKGRDRERLLRRFGMLFQGSALFDSVRVWRNVAFGLISAHGMSKREARAFVASQAAWIAGQRARRMARESDRCLRIGDAVLVDGERLTLRWTPARR